MEPECWNFKKNESKKKIDFFFFFFFAANQTGLGDATLFSGQDENGHSRLKTNIRDQGNTVNIWILNVQNPNAKYSLKVWYSGLK